MCMYDLVKANVVNKSVKLNTTTDFIVQLIKCEVHIELNESFVEENGLMSLYIDR